MRGALAAMMLVAGCASVQDLPMTQASKPIVIAHRGASGYRPEHTLAAYELAIDQGADFIEPDLVLTRDNVFVARHENEISGTTDVADRPEFAARKATKTIDGVATTGWFTEDFVLAELKTLRAKERLPQLRTDSAGRTERLGIPTLAEVIALAKRRSAETGRVIGIYPETKHPSYFASIGLPMEARLAAELTASGWSDQNAPVFIQSFEVNNLKALRKLTGVRLVQLVGDEGGPADAATPSYAAMVTPAGLAEIATYADGLGPAKSLVVSAEGVASSLVADAHRAGLVVHPWTFRAENFFLPAGLRVGDDPRAQGRMAEEIDRFVAAGVDGLFSDFPDLAVQAVAKRAPLR